MQKKQNQKLQRKRAAHEGAARFPKVVWGRLSQMGVAPAFCHAINPQESPQEACNSTQLLGAWALNLSQLRQQRHDLRRFAAIAIGQPFQRQHV